MSAAPRVLDVRVAGRRRETPTVLTVLFDPGDGGIAYEAGQHVLLELDGVDDPRGPRRSFTLSSSPSEPRLSISTKLTGSPFKEALASLEPGGEARIRGPMGSFVLERGRAAAMLTGGIGITPFRSMLRFAADRGIDTPIALLYSSSTPEEICFRRELDGIAAELPGLRVTYTVTRSEDAEEGWSGRTGRIDAAMIREITGDLDDPLYYVCGPPSMVEALKRILERDLGVARDDLRSEQFEGYA